MTARKALSIITAAAVLAGSASGCSLLDGKDNAAIEDTVEETFESSKDGDSTEDLEFSGLSEEAAMEAVSTFISYMAEGDLASAEAMNANAVGYDPVYADGDAYDEIMGNLMAAYFSNLDYELEVTEVTDDSITVAVTGTAPDADSAVTAAANDPDIMAPITADYIEATVYGISSNDNLEADLFAVVANAINSADLIPYSSFAVVTADEDGNLFVEPQYGFIQSFDFPEYMNESVVPAAIDLLLEQGRITDEQYDELTGIWDSSVSGQDASAADHSVSMEIIQEGDDCYLCQAQWVDNEEIVICVTTQNYYDEGTEFNYVITYYDGITETSFEGSYVAPRDDFDSIVIILPSDDGIYPHECEVTIYDANADYYSDILVDFVLTII